MDNLYKVFQVSEIFISRYGYKQILLESFSSYNRQEHWLVNENDPNYQLIRITTLPPTAVTYDKERIEAYLGFLTQRFQREMTFLDLHISREPYVQEDEEYPHGNIEEGYYDGVDLKQIYPEIYECIHEVSDKQKEIIDLVHRMSGVANTKKAAQPSMVQRRPIASYIIMGLCVLNYLLSLYLSRKYDMSVVYVLLGADYKTFTLGLREFYRFLTCGFVHGGLLHLLTNMYSLYVLGNYIERRYGSFRFLCILFLSVLSGSLSQAILSENTILVGLSGGLYGLMIYFILDLIRNRNVPFQTFLPLIVINLGVNFLSTTAFIAHMGGMICGYLLYLVFTGENKAGMSVLLLVFILSLFLKYVKIDTIEPLYRGTDLQVVEALKDLGLEGYSRNIMERLIQAYQRYGG